MKDDRLKDQLVLGFKNIIRDGRIPTSWGISNTRLVKKKDKPTVKDFRPIVTWDQTGPGVIPWIFCFSL